MFGKKTIYLGNSLQKFSDIKTILDNNNIKFSSKVRNHQNQYLSPEKGSIRGAYGTLGTDLNASNMYEIRVSLNDFEKAIYLIENRD